MEDNENLPLPMGDVYATDRLADEDREALRSALWRLMSRHAARYTMGDSSSLPVGTANELLSSIAFTLHVYLKENGAGQKLLLAEELDVLLKKGQEMIEEKISEGRRLWEDACIHAPDIENISFRDTLRSIGGFFKRYDYRFFSHQIPCDIDYQLCLPVPESLRGIEYVNEYLRRVNVENTVLGRFERGRVIRLLESCCPDYRGLLINLCEPVIVNSVGLALAGEAARGLNITGEDRAAIARVLEPLPESKARTALKDAAGRFCRELGIDDGFALEYVGRVADGLYPRISAGLPGGNLDGIFIAFE